MPELDSTKRGRMRKCHPQYLVFEHPRQRRPGRHGASTPGGEKGNAERKTQMEVLLKVTGLSWRDLICAIWRGTIKTNA
jgi:hypothetical protein